MRLKNKAGHEKTLDIKCDELAWFKTSPDAGDPDCICSYCGFVIPEDEVPIRLSHDCHIEDCALKKQWEARLHQACFRLLVK